MPIRINVKMNPNGAPKSWRDEVLILLISIYSFVQLLDPVTD